MEGDVDGVMARPTAAGADMSPEELAREQDKWDAWHLQKGISRTEAKRRYVETLIETMHKYATTPNAMALVGELEFVWNQVKNNATSSSGSSPGSGARQFLQPLSGTEGPMKVLSPMSEEDASERRMIAEEEAEDHVPDDGEYVKKGDKWSKKMERAIVRLSAEIAALREQITTGREWRLRKERSPGAWIGWLFWNTTKHLAVDLFIIGLVLLWMRRRRDRRVEDHIRGSLRVAREYISRMLPSR